MLDLIQRGSRRQRRHSRLNISSNRRVTRALFSTVTLFPSVSVRVWECEVAQEQGESGLEDAEGDLDHDSGEIHPRGEVDVRIGERRSK